jgi:hypothetical protein
MKLKELQDVKELNLTQLMEIKGGYARQVLDCGGNLCANTGCITNADLSCDTRSCLSTICNGTECSGSKTNPN